MESYPKSDKRTNSLQPLVDVIFRTTLNLGLDQVHRINIVLKNGKPKLFRRPPRCLWPLGHPAWFIGHLGRSLIHLNPLSSNNNNGNDMFSFPLPFFYFLHSSFPSFCSSSSSYATTAPSVILFRLGL